MAKTDAFEIQLDRMRSNTEWWISKSMPKTQDCVDHFSCDFPQSKTLMNGHTKNVIVSQVFKDGRVQELLVEIKPGGMVPPHSHPHYCVIKVVSGTIYDPVTEKRYRKGDVYSVEPGKLHGIVCSVDTSYVNWNTPDKEVARHIELTGSYRPKIVA